MIFSYFNVCRYDKQCHIDVMAIGILRKLLQKDRIIKERCFAIFLLTFISDGFLIFSYFNVCRYDKECRIDVMAIGGATNLLLLMGFIYLLFLHNRNQNIRKNITSGVSI